MNQSDQSEWKHIKESRMQKGMIDLLRKKISGEEYERIGNQTYEQYREEGRQFDMSPVQGPEDGAGRLVIRS